MAYILQRGDYVTYVGPSWFNRKGKNARIVHFDPDGEVCVQFEGEQAVCYCSPSSLTLAEKADTK